MKVSLLSPARYRVSANPLRSQRRVELAVLVLALVLCAQLLYSGARLLLMSAPAPVPPAADALSVGQMLAAQPVTAGQRGEIVSRPLFWQSRRPLADQDLAARDDAARGKVGKLKGIRLLGVFGGGDTAGVIVQHNKRKRRILLDEEIAGWTLESVEPDRVVFGADGRTETLILKARTVTASSPAPAPAGQRAARQASAKPVAATQGSAEKASRQSGKPAPASAGQDELSLGGSPAK